MTSRRILYAGNNHALADTLRERLKHLNCDVIRAPTCIAHIFIRSDIKYTVFLFDDTPAGVELESYARTLTHRQHTPILRVKTAQGVNPIVDALARLLRD